MVGINDTEFSPEGGAIRALEWKGGTLPFERSAVSPTTGNQIEPTSMIQKE
jgi:hypothetical protein